VLILQFVFLLSSLWSEWDRRFNCSNIELKVTEGWGGQGSVISEQRRLFTDSLTEWHIPLLKGTAPCVCVCVHTCVRQQLIHQQLLHHGSRSFQHSQKWKMKELVLQKWLKRSSNGTHWTLALPFGTFSSLWIQWILCSYCSCKGLEHSAFGEMVGCMWKSNVFLLLKFSGSQPFMTKLSVLTKIKGAHSTFL
jgi:hypothetical protein